MYIAEYDVWYRSDGSTNCESLNVKQYETIEQAQDAFNKLLSDAATLEGTDIPTGAKIEHTGRNQAHVRWYTVTGTTYLLNRQVFTMTEQHPIENVYRRF